MKKKCQDLAVERQNLDVVGKIILKYIHASFISSLVLLSVTDFYCIIDSTNRADGIIYIWSTFFDQIFSIM